MDGDELKAVLIEIGITQADFARLVGVTSRAVTLWMANDRAIPGPIEGYIRLFRLLPPNLRQVELGRLKQKGETAMRDGMYGFTFQGQQGAGMGLLIFENGRVYGTDVARVRYDGEYLFNEASGIVEVRVKVTYPPNVKAVMGISNPYEWSIDITTSFDPKQSSGNLALRSSLGHPISAQYSFLRSLPEAA